MNDAKVMGRIANEMELKYVGANNTPFMRMTVAVNRPKRAGEAEAATDWIPCVVWGKQAETIHNFLRKGNRILVEGPITTNKYKNKDGNMVNDVCVTVNKFEFVDGKSTSGAVQMPTTSPVSENKETGGFAPTNSTGFMNIPNNIGEELPFD